MAEKKAMAYFKSEFSLPQTVLAKIKVIFQNSWFNFWSDLKKIIKKKDKLDTFPVEKLLNRFYFAFNLVAFSCLNESAVKPVRILIIKLVFE